MCKFLERASGEASVVEIGMSRFVARKRGCSCRGELVTGLTTLRTGLAAILGG
jgi:hypothetical protein